MTKPRTEFPTAKTRDGAYGGKAYKIRSVMEMDGSETSFWETEDRTGHVVLYPNGETQFIRGTLFAAMCRADCVGAPASATTA